MAGHESQKSFPIRSPGDESSYGRSTVSKMNLLDLPVDILKEIIKNLTHTNDLTSTALVHSALHSLAIPHIYSRFDIVWPDGSTAGEPRGGVDALTYGLATLNMAEDVFGEAEWQRERRKQGGTTRGHSGELSERQIRRRRGNYYARYVRKFSLGNGPPDWVEEYLTNKEAGKMLGTLVALAIARMKSLESFIWDMPTGVLGDVWTSLSYLGDREDGEACRLEKIWIRWHRNIMLFPQIPPPVQDSGPVPVLRIDQSNALARTEHPSFSALPPLRSLSVLDIDEMQYLDEMSVLIGNSLDKLRELRIGIAQHCHKDDWVAPWVGDSYEQIDLSNPVQSTVTIGGRRRGGVLGVLTSSFLDLKQRDSPRTSLPRLRRISGAVSLNPSVGGDTAVATTTIDNAIPVAAAEGLPGTLQPLGLSLGPKAQVAGTAVEPQPGDTEDDVGSEVTPLGGVSTTTESNNSEIPGNPLASSTQARIRIESKSDDEPASPPQHSCATDAANSLSPPVDGASEEIQDASDIAESPPATKAMPVRARCDTLDYPGDEHPRRLHLETLELEWVQLSIPVLTAALDWTKLTTLTLLDCQHHDELWIALHEEYAKDVRAARGSLLAGSARPRRLSISIPHPSAIRLRLKHIHTNTVSLALIRFLNECIAPNTLESLYFQDFSGNAPAVTLETIFSAVIKLHRLSLRSLLLDSCKRKKEGGIGRGTAWKRWALTTEQIKYVTTPLKMPVLKELGFCVEHGKDWHFFKQRLPNLPQLRSLYIPRYSSPFDAPDPSPKEMAMQLLDAVVFNPTMELCYMGIYEKCFEILEGEQDHHRHGVVVSSSRGHHDDSSEDDEEEVDDEDDEDDDEEDDDDQRMFVGGARRESAGEFEYVGSDDEEDVASGDGRLHIREILFYEDKVPVFRVRHGHL
ncbi:hypothetical protein CAC42_3888 [Sphaceloma murrayae]|uniref:F-box domain-containing protein n=1 Tax=Sphaceloma murrayae TaxID=2082308 RepID=A0A2K1QSG9_9PEZI|nr:hypothetical protein CAC42_3888 [Sphaceloma murrayae]